MAIDHDEHARSLLTWCLSAPDPFFFLSFLIDGRECRAKYTFVPLTRNHALYCVVPLEIILIHNCINAWRYVANCRGAIAEEVQKTIKNKNKPLKEKETEGKGEDTQSCPQNKNNKHNNEAKKKKGKAGKSPSLHYPCFRCWMLVGCWDGCMSGWMQVGVRPRE